MFRKFHTKQVHVYELDNGQWAVSPSMTLQEAFRWDRRRYGLWIALYNLTWLLLH